MIDPNRIHFLDAAPTTSLDDLAPLLAIVGDARVVAVGEGAHFVSEYWAARQRLIHFLHERAGFTVVAMEFGVGEALDLTGWLEGEGAVEDLSSVSPAAAEWGAADLMRFLRAQHAAASTRGSRPMSFAGIDLPIAGGSFRPALDPLGRYIQAVDPDLTPLLDHVRAISDRIDAGSGVSGAAAWSELEPSQRDAVLSGLIRIALRMEALRPHYRAHRAPIAHSTALLLARSALATGYMLQTVGDTTQSRGLALDTSVRERFLADSVLARLERPEDKIIVIAHNNHVQKTPVTFAGTTHTLPMGLFLAERLRDDYCVIGQTTTDDHAPDMVLDPTSTVGFRVVDQPLPPAREASLERSLVTAAANQRPSLVDVRRGTGMPALTGIRSQGGYVDTDVSAAFDAVINHPRISRQADLFRSP